MLMNPAHVPGETVGQLYNRMVAYARTLDPRFVGGAASVPEMDRVKKAIETFERQARRKKPATARQRAVRTAPAGRRGARQNYFAASRAEAKGKC